MMLNIGIVSGEILELFDEVQGSLTVKEIEVYLGGSRDDILMSLGWLVREGFLIVEEREGKELFKRSNKVNKECLTGLVN